MPRLNRDEMRALSDQFRAFYQTFDDDTKDYFKEVIQTTFAIKNARNVDLWTTTNSRRANFVNANCSNLEMNMRVQFVKALTNGSPPSGPQKESKFNLWPERNGLKLREYLLENYTRRNVTSIGFLNGQVIFTYDEYADDPDPIEEDDTDEFDDLFDE